MLNNYTRRVVALHLHVYERNTSLNIKKHLPLVHSKVTTLEDYEDLLLEDDVEDSDDDDDDDDDDVMPRGNSQVERCIETLRGILGDAVPRRELLRVTLAADCDPNRALNFYFA